MRTTLDIEDDVLFAAKERARSDQKTLGQVITELARQGLNQNPVEPSPGAEEVEFFGFRPFPKRGVVITNELINRIREEEGI